MADETKRIIDQDNDQTLSAGDYVMVDSQAEGTRKFDLGSELTAIKEDLQNLDGGITADLKAAMLDIAAHVAYDNVNGQTYYNALYNALYPSASSITCVYTQSGTVYTTDTLNSLKSDLVVTAHYSDSTTRTLSPSDYTLTGTLTAGTSTIAVHYGNLTTTFTVTVTARTLSSISAVYTQSGEVYADDALDGLKSDLVVTAIYSDSTTEVVPSTDYELSGTLVSGTSTVTVTYENKTTTFNVTVTAPLYSIPDFAETSLTIGGYSFKISKTNDYFTMSGKASDNVFIPLSGVPSATRPTTTFFSVEAGDKIVYRIKDITWSNPTVKEISFMGKLSRSDADGNIYSTSTLTMTAGGSGSGAEIEYVNAGVASSRTLSALAIQFYGNNHTNDNVTATFKVEIYVNDVRYL